MLVVYLASVSPGYQAFLPWFQIVCRSRCTIHLSSILTTHIDGLANPFVIALVKAAKLAYPLFGLSLSDNTGTISLG